MTDPYGQPTTSASTTNSIGKAAFAIAVVTFALGIASQIAFLFVLRSGDFGVTDGFYFTRTILGSIAYLVALVLGVVAARDAASQRLLPGIAIGISGSALLGTLAFTLANWLILSTY